MTTIPYLTPKVVAALRKQNDIDGKGGWKAKIGVDDVALLLDAAEALPALTERVKAAERESARLRKGMLEVPPQIAEAMGDEVTKLRTELAALKTLHTDKIIAFDAEHKALAAARAEVESARAKLAAVAGLSAHYDELADFIQESGVRGTKDGPEYHWYRNATAEIRAALDAAAADPAAATGEGEARDGN